MLSICLFLHGVFFDNESGTVLCFEIHLADIFTYNTYSQKLNTAQCPDRCHKTRPACGGVTQEVLHEGIDQNTEADGTDDNAQTYNKVDRTDA